MFNLISPKKKNVSFVLIDDFGGISSHVGELEYFINGEESVYETFEAIIDKYTKNINVLRGYSSYDVLNQDEIKTSQFNVKTDGTLTHNVMFMSYLGNITQAFTDSIMHEMTTSMNNVGNEYSNVFVNMKANDTITTLINASLNGITIKSVVFNIEHGKNISNAFQNDASKKFNDILFDFNKRIIYNEAHIGKDFYIHGNNVIESNMNFKDDVSISESIYNDLYVIAKDANISSLNIIS